MYKLFQLFSIILFVVSYYMLYIFPIQEDIYLPAEICENFITIAKVIIIYYKLGYFFTRQCCPYLQDTIMLYQWNHEKNVTASLSFSRLVSSLNSKQCKTCLPLPLKTLKRLGRYIFLNLHVGCLLIIYNLQEYVMLGGGY